MMTPSRSRMTSAAVALVLAFLLCSTVSTAFGQRGPAIVAVSPVVEREVSEGQTFVGTVTPVRRSVVGSAVDGRVAEFPVNDGDFVRKGQPLAQLLTQTIGLEVSAARSELKLREEELRELENGSRPEELRRAKAIMLADEAIVEYERKRMKRAKELFDRNAINDDELQQVISEATKAEQQYQQAVEVHALAVAGPRKEQIEQARARLAMQQAVTDKLTDQLGKHTIKAPFDGYVVAEFTEVGQWVQRGEHVAEVIALDEVDVIAQVLENHATHVRRGQAVRVEIPALPDQLLTGMVVAVVPQADLRSRTFPVQVRVKNSVSDGTPLLKSGMLGRVTLPTGPLTKALLVPKDALVLGGPQPSVSIVVEAEGDKPSTTRPVPVVLGVAAGGMIQVKGELASGDQVVVRGNERLRPGQPIQITQVIDVEGLQSTEADTDAGEGASNPGTQVPEGGK